MYYYVGRFARGVDVLGVIDEPSGVIPGDVLVGNATGQTWEILQDVLPTSSGYQDVVYSQELGVFCTFAPGASPLSHTSDDLGETWTAGTAMPNGSGFGICWSPDIGKFLVGAPLAANVMLSDDGLAWTDHTHTTWAARVCPPVWAGGTIQKFVISYDGNINPSSDSILAYSSDGETWTLIQPFGAGNQGMATMCYSPDRDELVGMCGNKNSVGSWSRLAWRSSNAIAWSSSQIVAADHQWSRVIWSRRLQKYVAIAGYGGAFLSVNENVSAVSDDAITWTVASGMPFSGHWRVLAETGKCLVALLSGGVDSDNVAVSTDGLTWSTVALSSGAVWSGLAPRANLGTT